MLKVRRLVGLELYLTGHACPIGGAVDIEVTVTVTCPSKTRVGNGGLGGSSGAADTSSTVLPADDTSRSRCSRRPCSSSSFAIFSQAKRPLGSLAERPLR